ncbi:Ribosomal protein/NADH dehydrogenase domain-containing protein [Plasmodiophora brassicae]|uniref:Ribosomal protein/NADH dehydrogenase domain-containing protein n=1 Tax=Plasmodiophora brassicae TaxID=37360 RepID=A0A0G4IQ26_PLABS|nr:hypothetical protein PBRA_000655 [Plasmodiophora brassicae]SPQ97617.1 unnamed protein product [Plasmodiophora brassicae]
MSSAAKGAAIRFSPLLREIRLHFCQTSASSAGIRSFVVDNYWALRRANPDVSILVRECHGIKPRIVTRFHMTPEQDYNVESFAAGEIADVVKNVTQAIPGVGESAPIVVDANPTAGKAGHPSL